MFVAFFTCHHIRVSICTHRCALRNKDCAHVPKFSFNFGVVKETLYRKAADGIVFHDFLRFVKA